MPLKIYTSITPANINMFKVVNRNSTKRCEMGSKLTNENTKTMPMTSFWCFYYQL